MTLRDKNIIQKPNAWKKKSISSALRLEKVQRRLRVLPVRKPERVGTELESDLAPPCAVVSTILLKTGTPSGFPLEFGGVERPESDQLTVIPPAS